MRTLSSFLLLFLFTLNSVWAQPPTEDKIITSRDYFNLGVKSGIANDFEKAIEEFEKAIELNPLFAEAFLYKGLAEIETQNYDQAIKDFTITIELDPAFSDQAHYFRGLARFYQDKLELAVEDFTIAIRMNPDFVSFFQRGKANLKLGEYRRSLQDFDIALRLNEEFYEGHLYRGINLYYLEMYEEALTDLDLAKKHLPDNSEVLYYNDLVTHAILNPQQAREKKLAHQQENRQSSSHNTTPQAIDPPVSAEGRNDQPPASDNNRGRNTQLVSDTADNGSVRPSSTDINFAGLFNTSREATENTPSADQTAQAQVAAQQTNLSAETLPARPLADIDELETGIYSKNLEQIPLNGFGVQVASYSTTSNLLSLSEAYAEKYARPVFINVSDVNGRKLYKLIIGRFDDRSDAEAFRDNLRKDDFPDSFLILFGNI